MEYFDASIVNARHIKRREEYGSIEEGMYIKNVLTNFKEVLIFEKKFSIMLPEDFVPMLPEIIEIKYALGNTPDVIYTSMDTSVNISMNLYPDISSDGDLELAMGVLKRMIKNMNPSNVFYEDINLESNSGDRICMFDFKSYALDDAVYNISYILKIQDDLLQGTFSCIHYDMDEWKRAAVEMIKSIRKV